MTSKEIKLYLIIAFLIGMLSMDLAHALKVPNLQLQNDVSPELRDIIENYVIPILNTGKYQTRVSPAEILATDELVEGESVMEVSGVTKRFVISDGVNNYYVNLTAM